MDYKKYARTFQRIKQGILPKNPLTVAEINEAFAKQEIQDAYGHALHSAKQPFFNGAVQYEKHSICVFSSKYTIDLIEKNIPPTERHILMDGTFKVCPYGPFNQLLILYIRKDKKVKLNKIRTAL